MPNTIHMLALVVGYTVITIAMIVAILASYDYLTARYRSWRGGYPMLSAYQDGTTVPLPELPPMDSPDYLPAREARLATKLRIHHRIVPAPQPSEL